MRGNSSDYVAGNSNDGKPETYWATNEGVTRASITVEFDEPTEVNRILLQEYIPLGQRVQNFIAEAEVDGKWIELDGQTTIGHRRILKFETVKATKIRVDFKEAKGPLAISSFELYRAPNFLVPPKISRDVQGMVSFSVPDKDVLIYYTTDGSTPTIRSDSYEKPFLVDSPTTVMAIAVDPKNGGQTQPVSTYFDIAKQHWKVDRTSSGEMDDANKIIDEDPNTFWATDEGVKTPQEVTIDLGGTYNLTGFTYWPNQDRYPFGIITNYEFATSANGINWSTVAKGEFSNIVNSRLEQTVMYGKTRARFIKLRGVKVDGEDFRTSFAEIGVITEN